MNFSVVNRVDNLLLIAYLYICDSGLWSIDSILRASGILQKTKQ